LEHGSATTALVQMISLMCVTNPPVKCLGIYHHVRRADSDGENKKLLARIRNDGCVRVSQVLDALHRVAPTILETWQSRASELLDSTGDAHWIDDVWTIPGYPRILIHLDHIDMQDAEVNSDAPWGEMTDAKNQRQGLAFHASRQAYMVAESTRRERESEWLPEEPLESMKSTTDRAEINWET
jgi:hypothetical protein